MENKAIVEITKYALSKKDFEDIPEDQVALIGLLNYAATELNCLQRVYIASSQGLTGENHLDVGIASQRYTLLRVWSAKLFELMQCLEDLCKPNRKIDEVVLEVATTAREAMVELKENDAYPLVRNIRDNATNHYSFKDAKKNLRHVSEGADFSLYLHEMDGNSYYPMGEELMFVGRINRFGSGLSGKAARQNLLNAWMDWNLLANHWVRATHVDAFERLVMSKYPRRAAWSKKHYVPVNLVGNIEKPVVPLFMKRTVG
ncbi:hypothetical protein [Tateyamaria sp.]|uniref:hypothetical protein n=1 Tax=Tateyamaria sp. TaxID=1929288 RepID=UPI00329B05C4